MILPKIRDPRLITIRRGGTLTDADHHLLALWAADCAEHVLALFEAQRPEDARPRFAIEQARAWARGEVPMMQARAAGGHAMAAARQEVAARDLSGAARFAAFAAGQAAVTAHVAAHDLGAAAYAIKAAAAEAAVAEAAATEAAVTKAATKAAAAALQEAQAVRRERDWQREQLPDAIRALVLDDQRRRNAICWFVFFDD